MQICGSFHTEMFHWCVLHPHYQLLKQDRKNTWTAAAQNALDIVKEMTTSDNVLTHKIRTYHIRKTCPCNVYPIEPRFYIAKLGYGGVYLFFLFLLQNIDCGYSLEPPRRSGSNVYPQSLFWAIIRKLSHIFSWKFSNLKGQKISVYSMGMFS